MLQRRQIPFKPWPSFVAFWFPLLQIENVEQIYQNKTDDLPSAIGNTLATLAIFRSMLFLRLFAVLCSVILMICWPGCFASNDQPTCGWNRIKSVQNLGLVLHNLRLWFLEHGLCMFVGHPFCICHLVWFNLQAATVCVDKRSKSERWGHGISKKCHANSGHIFAFRSLFTLCIGVERQPCRPTRAKANEKRRRTGTLLQADSPQQRWLLI